MGGGARRNGNANSLGGNRRRTGPSFSSQTNDNNDYDDSSTPVTMSQVNSVVAKNDKAMQVLIENYRRNGTNTPLWFSSAPYYKKDALLVINLRDEKETLSFEVDSDDKKISKDETKTTKPERQGSPTPQTNTTKTFAVSGGDAASRLGLRIGAAAENPVVSKTPTTILKNEAKKTSPPVIKQPEMAFIGNVKNLSTFDSGLDNILLGTNPSTDPLSINSDPLWGTDTISAPLPDLDDLQNVLTTLQNLAPSLDMPKSEAATSSPNPKTQSSENPIGSTATTQPQGVTTTAALAPTASGQPSPAVAPSQQQLLLQQQLQQQLAAASAAQQQQQQAPHQTAQQQQFYYYMSQQGVPMLNAVPTVAPNQLQQLQQLQLQMQMQQQQLLMLGSSYYQQNPAQSQQAAQLQAAQAAVMAQQRALAQQLYYPAGVQMINPQLAKQQQQQQHQQLLAAQQAAAYQQQLAAQQAAQHAQQQALAQQQAALAAQQLLSKAPASTTAPSQPAAAPAVPTSTAPSQSSAPKSAPASIPSKAPNPNARPFQPPSEKRFNVEAAPFVPPTR